MNTSVRPSIDSTSTSASAHGASYHLDIANERTPQIPRPHQSAGVERQILRAVLGAAALLLVVLTKADADLWGHVRFGGDIVRGGIHESDPYSFTSDIPWVNHEWLAEVLFWWAWAAAGGAGLVLLKVVLLGVVLCCAWDVLRRYALPPAAVEALFFVLVIGTWLRTSVVRPQLCSLALFAALLWALQRVEHGRVRLIWLVPVLFAVWINLHGGWIVGFGMFGLYCALTILSPRRSLNAQTILGVGIASAVSLLLNPYGWHMLEFIATTVGLNRSDITDWQPLWRGGLGLGLWACSAGVAAFVILRQWRSLPLWQVTIALILGVVALRVSRLDAFFAIAVVMLLGPHLGVPRQIAARQWHPAPLITAAATTIGIVAGSFSVQPITCIGLDVSWAPEREAGAFIKANQLKGRLLTWFDWGQYVIWHSGPELRVSVDGRRETVYSERFLQTHDQLYVRPEENAGVLAAMNADYAWLPTQLPLVRMLDEQGWARVFAGPRSIVFARHPGRFVNVAALDGAECFPGP